MQMGLILSANRAASPGSASQIGVRKRRAARKKTPPPMSATRSDACISAHCGPGGSTIPLAAPQEIRVLDQARSIEVAHRNTGIRTPSCGVGHDVSHKSRRAGRCPCCEGCGEGIRLWSP